MTEILNTRDGDYSVPTGLRHGRLVDNEIYTDPDTQAAVEQWAQEREAYDKTAVEMGHRPWGGSHGGTQSKWG